MPLNPDEILSSPKSKIKWAYKHIDSIRSAVEPLRKDWYTISVEPDIMPPYRHPDGFILTYRPAQPFAEELALMVGDAVHNFRTALDHLASGIARCADPAAKPFFPMSKNREELPSHSGFSAIEKALPGSKDLLLKQIRPENGANETLWSFFSLDNDDKHNALITVVTATRIRDINLNVGSATIRDCEVGGDASKPINIIRSKWPITFQNNFKTIVDVRFGDASPFKDEPVIPTLLQIGDLVSKTVDMFGRLMRI